MKPHLKAVNTKKIYESISLDRAPKNKFDKVHPVTMTGKIGNLMPCMVLPVVPGDKVHLDFDLLIRFPALVSPAMVSMHATIHAFYVADRIVHPGFDEFFEGQDGYAQPRMVVESSLTADQQKFLDYFGIPPIADSTLQESIQIRPNAMAAYQKIYNDYYRPRPFEDPVDFELPETGGVINSTLRSALLTMRKRSWEHDYFTSMLPEPLVAPDVTLGIGDVILKENWDSVVGATPQFVDDTFTLPGGVDIKNLAAGLFDNPLGSPPKLAYNPDGSLEVANATINNLRQAYARMRYLEKMGRAGGEYYEIIQAIYSQRIPDARLQRAEYITGIKTPILINPVLSTAETTDAPIGQQGGHAIAVESGNGLRTFEVPEHGHIIAILSVIPKPVYKQGIPRHFRAFEREELIIPDLANIGEQPVYSWEITAYEQAESAITTVGYMPNYTDRKEMMGRIAGEFRSAALQSYTVVKEFAGVPSLDASFVQVPEDIADHIFVATSGITDPLWINVLNVVLHETCLPVYSDPI